MFNLNELKQVTRGKLINQTKNICIKGISIDSRTIKPREAFIAIKGDNFDGHDFIASACQNGAACIIKEAGKGKLKSDKYACIEVEDSVKALGEIANFHRWRFDIPIIAITGSNGKTTTKDMAAWVLSKKFKVLKTKGTENNQIGVPLTLLGLKPGHQAAIVELGTNHFGEIKNLAGICSPNIGIITNIGLAHLEYFGNEQEVLREKYSLVENLSAAGIAILNADDRLLGEKIFRPKKSGIILSFGASKNSDFRAMNIQKDGRGIKFLVNGRGKVVLPTFGAGNVYNGLAAISCARILGLSYDEISDSLSDFDFPNGRLKLRKFKSIQFIDDSYNSNPVSLKHALDALEDFSVSGDKIVIMADMMELGEDKEKLHYLAGLHIARVCDKFIAVGELAQSAAEAARQSGFNVNNIYSCGSGEEAREILFQKINPNKNDLVLVKGSRIMRMEKIFER